MVALWGPMFRVFGSRLMARIDMAFFRLEDSLRTLGLPHHQSHDIQWFHVLHESVQEVEFSGETLGAFRVNPG